ncbi:GHKL domain-containing protein [Clostridium butyricum]|jgi:two-component system sensor histidine kinase AgrC|uniref:GHKL domain-containing protein n=3 Tax=Clostridium butyricum TaxID=1492 RepID=UPI001BA5B29D|nr:GHKL domain-containing protein [Clostridium butyricum]MDU1005634.1 GHKL domain-containing protein [Clostridium butyricum]QUF83675.1 GHKL domain-containing protein [Clostridium butyricum]
MLSDFIINSIDSFNIIYLWVILTKKNNNIFKLLSSVLIFSVLVTAIEQLGLNFIITYIAGIMTIKIIYKGYLKEVISGYILVLLIEISLGLIFSLFINKLIYDDTYIAIITELIILVITIISSKTKLFKKNIIFELIDNNALIYFIVVCFSYASVFKIIWNYDDTIILNNLFSISLIFCTLVISQFLTYLYLLKVIKERETLKISNEYNEVIDEIVQEIKQRQHDFVNYKNTIRGIISVVDEKDVKSAINNYIKDEELHDNKINELIYIDNVVIRSIIYRNICKAEKYNVNFKYKIENNIFDNILSYHEISNLLNNLLNNAFDEVLKEECNKKNIEVKIFNEEKTSHLIVKSQIVNPNDININEMFTRGYSTKNTTGTRGYGLYNVQQIVNLHKGYIKLNVEYEEIIFDIYYNNSSG